MLKEAFTLNRFIGTYLPFLKKINKENMTSWKPQYCFYYTKF